jgi:hypothetical protein
MEIREDDDRMLHATHAMVYHWGEAAECRPENRARAEFPVSRVYTVPGRGSRRCGTRSVVSTTAAAGDAFADPEDREHLGRDYATP